MTPREWMAALRSLGSFSLRATSINLSALPLTNIAWRIFSLTSTEDSGR